MNRLHYIISFALLTFASSCIRCANNEAKHSGRYTPESQDYFLSSHTWRLSGNVGCCSLAGQYLIKYSAYSVLYDSNTKIPVWVKYELTASETEGPYSRKGKNFRPDDSVSIPQADYSDYRNSGWSRGHMAPAADFKWSDEAMWDTFFYTNCSPQDASLNNGQWNVLENKVRSWARKYGKINVITGTIIGQNINGTIGANKVVVPDAFFKAVLADTHYGLQTIAFVMYNRDNNDIIQKCAMSVNDLEKLTGLDLFEEIHDSDEEYVESAYKLKLWGL